MRIRMEIEFEKCENAELIEKIKTVKDRYDYKELCSEYGADECADAFATVYWNLDSNMIGDTFYERVYEDMDNWFAYDVEEYLEWKALNPA